MDIFQKFQARKYLWGNHEIPRKRLGSAKETPKYTGNAQETQRKYEEISREPFANTEGTPWKYPGNT